MKREMKEIEYFYHGKWRKTKGIVIDGDLCKYPNCNRKIPSKRTKLPYSRKGYPKTYCSRECYQDHKNGEHRVKLNSFF